MRIVRYADDLCHVVRVQWIMYVISYKYVRRYIEYMVFIEPDLSAHTHTYTEIRLVTFDFCARIIIL